MELERKAGVSTLTAVGGASGADGGARAARARSAAVPGGAARARVAVLCGSEVIQRGLVALLPEEWQARAAVVADVVSLGWAMVDSCAAVIIDGSHAGARDGIRLARGRGVAVVVIADAASELLMDPILDETDAILIRDEVDQFVLRMALAAGRLGMRLLPRRISTAQARVEPRLGEDGRRALTMLASGQRDADIARKLNLSESAVRKLVQRTVRAMGARTRCEAVAIATRGGLLG